MYIPLCSLGIIAPPEDRFRVELRSAFWYGTDMNDARRPSSGAGVPNVVCTTSVIDSTAKPLLHRPNFLFAIPYFRRPEMSVQEVGIIRIRSVSRSPGVLSNKDLHPKTKQKNRLNHFAHLPIVSRVSGDAAPVRGK